MSRSRRVNQEIFSDLTETREIDGERVVTYVSPYDAPRSVSYVGSVAGPGLVGTVGRKGYAKVVFSYADDEKGLKTCKHAGTEVGIGRHSNRIKYITFPQRGSPDQIVDGVMAAIEDHRSEAKSPDMNIRATERVVQEQLKLLLESDA